LSDLSEALNKQGLTFLAKRDNQRAIAFFREAIDVEPTMADAHTNLGVTQFMDFKFTDALVSLRHSLSLRPDHAETLLNLGYCLWRLNDLPGAIDAFHNAIEVGDLPLAQIALGSVYWEVGNAELALHYCRLGLVREPESILARDTIREVYHFHGNKAAAVEACDAMIKLLPERATNHHKKAMVLMTYGDPAGWPMHECRYDALDGTARIITENADWFRRTFGRRWDGRPTGHLVVATEQGYGDVIQFLRFLPMAAERCTKLTVHLPKSLRKIVSQSFQIPHMTISTDFPEEFDHYCLIMSLAYLMDATETFPTAPYLVASNNKYDEVRRLDGLKVGISWEGSRTMPDDRWRTMPFAKVKELLQDIPARFVSLQFPCNENLKGVNLIEVHPTQTSYSGELMIDWTETAGLINALDLVISVDTSVAHMVGALGKPIWMMNRYNTDWRWGLERSDTLWYPSMRIFRLAKMGDWDSVIAAVRPELLKLI
jgi:hypothetical protein